MVVPCWFTLWTSSRFLHHYFLLISIEIFLIFLVNIIIQYSLLLVLIPQWQESEAAYKLAVANCNDCQYQVHATAQVRQGVRIGGSGWVERGMEGVSD